MDTPPPLASSGVGAEMERRFHAHDWAATPLGLRTQWPSPLKTLVGVMLAALQPMFLVWGPCRILLYNDAYTPLLGQKHQDALGRPFFEVWPEAAKEIGPLFVQVFAGQPVQMDDIALMLERHGRPEQAHFAFAYTPVWDGGGEVAGLLCTCIDTTARVLAERAQAAQAERQQRLFERAPGFIAVLTGPNHVFEFVNHSYVRLAGERDFLGRRVRSVFPELAGQGFLELLDQVYTTGERYVAHSIPIRLARSPGSGLEERHLDFIYEPVLDEAGVVTGIFVEGHDVTDAYSATKALQASEARLRKLNADLELEVIQRTQARGRTWQVSPDLLGALNAKGYFETSNPAWETVLGWSEEEVASMSIFEMLHPDDLERTRAGFELTQQGQPAIHFPNRYRCKDGSYRWISWVGVPDGGLVYCSGRDITAEKVREEELARRTIERDLLATIVETTDVLVMAVAVDFTILATNQANANEFERVYGVRPKVGDNMLGLLAGQPEHQAQVRAGWSRGLAGEEVTFTEDFGDPNRDRPYYEIKFRPLYDERGERIGCYQFVTDVTQRMREGAMLAEAQDQLRQAQKMEAIGQLTGGLAHDVNNMLQGIGGALQMIQRRTTDGRLDELPRLFRGAQEGVNRAAALTQRLLAFARRSRLEETVVGVNDLVLGLTELVRRTVGPAIEVRTCMRNDGCLVRCDPNGLESALLNLAINARDAMPDGGGITFTTKAVRLSAGAFGAGEAIRSGDYVLVAVSDSGVGMTPDVVARAFEPFFTTKPIGKGTGLGLSQIHGFVHQSGGIVRLESAPGRGTTVCIYLPRHEGEPSAEVLSAPVRSAATADAVRGTVLLVEDETAVRTLAAEALRDFGLTVLEAEDGPSGLAMLLGAPVVDLLVTDVGLPGLNGRQLADAVREHYPMLPVLFITGYAGVALDGDLPTGMAAITKPFALDLLVDRVAAMLRTCSGHRGP